MSIKKPLSELDLICNQAQQAKLELRRASQSIKDDALKYGAAVSYTHLTLPTTPYV